jgi:hypothetical protein
MRRLIETIDMPAQFRRSTADVHCHDCQHKTCGGLLLPSFYARPCIVFELTCF